MADLITDLNINNIDEQIGSGEDEIAIALSSNNYKTVRQKLIEKGYTENSEKSKLLTLDQTDEPGIYMKEGGSPVEGIKYGVFVKN